MTAGGAGRVFVIEPMASAVTVLEVATALGRSTAAATWDEGERPMPDLVRTGLDPIIQVDPNDGDTVRAGQVSDARRARRGRTARREGRR